MMSRCIACKEIIWPAQKTGFNSSWHYRCAVIWQAGYNTAAQVCISENKLAGLPNPFELYHKRQGQIVDDSIVRP